jgi:hypothetical protein
LRFANYYEFLGFAGMAVGPAGSRQAVGYIWLWKTLLLAEGQ